MVRIPVDETVHGAPAPVRHRFDDAWGLLPIAVLGAFGQRGLDLAHECDAS